MKLEFLMCGNPTDAFLSQAAMFRMSLDSFDDLHRTARVVLCVGSSEPPAPLPERWRKPFERIELHWADPHEYAEIGDGAQGHELYRLISPDADISIICDADSMLVAPLPAEFLEEMERNPAIAGVIAHFGPPLEPFPGAQNTQAKDVDDLWNRLAQAILGRPISLETPYTLATDGSAGPRFYINHAFLAAPPRMLKDLFIAQQQVRPIVRGVLDNQFYDQITVAMAVELTGIPCRQLPMRFNFPNDRTADDLYPGELENAVLMHYLRTSRFDRHRIFANEHDFSQFMSIELLGSDKIFQRYVSRLTNGIYPFK